MILVKPSFEIWNLPDAPIKYVYAIQDPLILIEKAGRVCYKSEKKSNEKEKFVSNLIKRGHESVIEHYNVTVKFIVDRGVTHELVRHRLASYSQESTRYCNYKGGVTFVIPPWVKNLKAGEYKEMIDVINIGDPDLSESEWIAAIFCAERSYLNLLKEGWTPQQARSVLPNSLKTEIVMTANLREWRHVFKLRTSKAAHPQMREVMIPLLAEFKKLIPVVFDDIVMIDTPEVEILK